MVYINDNEYVAFSKDQVAVFEEDIPGFLEFGPSQINDTMYLSIRLPGHQFVQVRINNINYEDDVSIFTLKKDPTLSDVWWTQLELPNGVYDYEYSLPNGTTFPDPLSRMIKNNKTRKDSKDINLDLGLLFNPSNKTGIGGLSFRLNF